MAIHAAVMKRAQAAGILLVEAQGRVEARVGERVLAANGSASDVLKRAMADQEAERLRDLRDDPAPVLVLRRVTPTAVVGQLAPAPAPVALPKIIKGSIIKAQYKDKYKKNGDYSCGDDIADEMCAYIKVVVKGRLKVDLVRLKKVATDNGVWLERYSSLNPGQQRMTIGNRLRAKFTGGEQIDIGGAILVQEIKGL